MLLRLYSNSVAHHQSFPGCTLLLFLYHAPCSFQTKRNSPAGFAPRCFRDVVTETVILSSIKVITLLLHIFMTGVVQVPRRCPAQCQEWCRYPAGALPSDRAGAGTPQVPCSVSGVVQKLAYRVLGSAFPRGCLSACTRMPHREGNCMGGLPLFNIRIQNWRGCCDRLFLMLDHPVLFLIQLGSQSPSKPFPPPNHSSPPIQILTSS